MSANTLLLRLEGPLQAWGDQQSKFVIRRTARAPTKSGVLGTLCAALGVPRSSAGDAWLPKLSALHMAVRVDVPGVRWWDYHTVGAEMEMRIAEGEGKTKIGPILTRREYLCDASFLVVLQGEPTLIDELAKALHSPRWTPYLGRKCCPPSRPLLEQPPGCAADLESALKLVAWRPRLKAEKVPERVDCLLDWQPTPGEPEAPSDAQVWYDIPITFDPPVHLPRFVICRELCLGSGGELGVAASPSQRSTPRSLRPRANYRNTEYRSARSARLEADHGLCVFCKSPATTVQHVTYRRAGGGEEHDDLRALCRLCHDAVTMLEYGMGMGLDRIDPCDSRWRNAIVEKRNEIVRFRSLETRRRRLLPEEVE